MKSPKEKKDPPERRVICPQCGFEFNPEKLRSGLVILEPEEQADPITIGGPSRPGKAYTVTIDLSLSTRQPEVTERMGKSPRPSESGSMKQSSPSSRL